MKYSDPIAELRAFFASLRAPDPVFRARPACACGFCRRSRAQHVEKSEDRKTLKEGPFCARAAGSKSRYRETVLDDLFNGRRAGKGPGGFEHVAPTIKPMPKPIGIENLRASSVVAQIRQLVESVRIPKGLPSDLRQEIAAQAAVEFYAAKGALSFSESVEKARWHFRQQYPELR